MESIEPRVQLGSSLSIQISCETGEKAEAEVNPFYQRAGKAHRARESDVFFIARENGRIVGTVRYCVEMETPLLRSMLVEEGMRGKGIGQRLLHAFEGYLEANSVHDTFVIPYEHLVEFYASIGFLKVPEESAPVFLQERLALYRPTGNRYTVMRRP